jgi:outer membrane protein
MTTVTSVKEAYFNLLFARGNVDANTTALKLAQELVAQNLKRVEVGALAPLDEKQSESQAAASLAALQSSIGTLGTQENTLKNLLTDNYTEWADLSPVPSEELGVPPRILDRQESWRRAITQRPELIEAKLNVEKQNVQLKYDQNQIFPELDINGSYGRNAANPTLNGNFDDLKNGNASYYSYGASMSIPMGGNRAARNTYKSDKVLLKQVLLQLKQQEQSIIVAVDNDVGTVRSTLLQVDSTRAARLYAEDALAAERKKLENGKSTSFNVLQLISNLTTARVNEIQALANYNNALTQLSLDEGSTLEDNRIDMKVK